MDTTRLQSRTAEDSAIRAATLADADAIAGIYNHYITNTIVTFEEEAHPPSEIAARIETVWSASLPWLVAEAGGQRGSPREARSRERDCHEGAVADFDRSPNG